MLFNAISQISRDGPLTLSVDGDCMFNTIPNGAKVRIERRPMYWPGDIIVYGRGDDRLVMHRFLGYARGRHGWCGMTRADESKRADAPFGTERILGKVMCIDQEPAHPGLLLRLRSLLHYVIAIVSWAGRVIARFLKTIGVFRT